MAKRRVVNYDRLPDVKRGPYYLLDSLLGLGVGFTIDGDRLTATGQGASPVVQGLVDKHAPQLIAMLVDAGLQGGVMARSPKVVQNFEQAIEQAGQGSSQHLNEDPGVAIKTPDRMQLIRNGIEGAHKQQQKKRAMVQARRKVRA